MKTKVCIIIDHLGLGGAQTQLFEYLKKADKNSFNINVVSLDPSKNFLKEAITSLGYDVFEIAQKGFFDGKALSALTSYLKSTSPHVVHTYLFTADTYGRLAARLAGVRRVICSIRSIDHWKKAHHILADRILAGWTDVFTINAEGIRSFLLNEEKLTKSRIEKIYNGMDLSRFDNLRNPQDVREELGIIDGDIVLGMVGRLNHDKDHETLFAAVEPLASVYPRFKLLIVGDGPKTGDLHELATQHNLSSRTIFTGYRKDVLDITQIMDIGILSSHTEGCPNAVLEYMALGKPSVATDVGGVREVIADEETGFVVPKANVEELRDRIVKLIENESLRREMGAKGRLRVEQEFTSEKLAKNTEALYHELVQPKIAFLLSQFPEMHETFILREFSGQRSKGMNFEIYSYKRCRDKIIHPDAKPLMPMTVYANPIPLWSLLYILARHPIGFLKAMGCMFMSMFRHWNKPLDILKIAAVFLRSCYFARIMEQRRVTHIHAHWATMPTTGAQMIARMINITFSFTAHAWDIYLNQKSDLKQKIHDAKFAVTCTRANKEYIGGLNGPKLGGKVFVNYHGVNLEKFGLRQQPGIRREALIVAVGRLVEQKGFEYLIKACGILKRRSIPFRCVIIGNGPLREHFETMTTNLGLKEHVELLGSVPQEQIRNLFQEADVFAAPCVISHNGDRDGIPNVLLEAFSIGVPVVGTSVSGLPEVLIHGQTGIVVQERDERSLAKGLEQIIERRAPVDQLVQNGRRKMEEEFDMYKNVGELIKIFGEHGLVEHGKD